MNKKQAIMLGVAGAAVAAAVIGGTMLNNGGADVERASQGDSYQEDKAATGEMEQYQEQIRTFDREKQKCWIPSFFIRATQRFRRPTKLVQRRATLP